MAARSRTNAQASARTKKRKKAARRQPLPCTYWLGVGVVAAGLGVAMGTAGMAAAADGSSGGTTSSSAASSSASDSGSESSGSDSTSSDSTGTDSTDADSTDSDSEDADSTDSDSEDTDAGDADADADADDADDDVDEADDETDGDDETATDDDTTTDDDTNAGTSVEPVAATTPSRDHQSIPAEESEDAPAPAVDTQAPAEVEPAEAAPAPESVQTPEAVTTPTTAVTTKATAVSTAKISNADAALVSGHVTLGTMIVDVMTWIGLGPSPSAATLLPIRMPGFVESFWVSLRTQMYGSNPGPNPGNPGPNPGDPGNPGNPGTPGTGLPDTEDLPLVWETNFTSIEEALKYWGVQTGRWGQSAGENQYYTDFDNVYLNDEGHVVIVTRQETAPDGLGAPNNYTSTRLVTYGKASVTVGQRIVARIQMPYTQGSLPAFWTVGLEPGHEFDWPRQGEIDIVELPGFGNVDGSKHWTGNIHGPAQGNNTVDVKLHGNGADMGVDLSQGFHDYGIDWHADRIVWHVDGKQVGEITKQQYEALGGDWTPFSGKWPHYLILNNAVGNPWTGDPDKTSVFPMEMKIDWVKVYEL